MDCLLRFFNFLFYFAGLVTGFFCCSVVPPSDGPPVPQIQNRPQKVGLPEKRPETVTKTVYICTPSEPNSEGAESNSWEENHTDRKYPWMASPASNCVVSSGSSTANSHKIGQKVPKRPIICRWCHSMNPGDDCHDGFCASIWNKENLMRPIHI